MRQLQLALTVKRVIELELKAAKWDAIPFVCRKLGVESEPLVGEVTKYVEARERQKV